MPRFSKTTFSKNFNKDLYYYPFVQELQGSITLPNQNTPPKCFLRGERKFSVPAVQSLALPQPPLPDVVSTQIPEMNPNLKTMQLLYTRFTVQHLRELFSMESVALVLATRCSAPKPAQTALIYSILGETCGVLRIFEKAIHMGEQGLVAEVAASAVLAIARPGIGSPCPCDSVSAYLDCDSPLATLMPVRTLSLPA